jgi:hypothetical protein
MERIERKLDELTTMFMEMRIHVATDFVTREEWKSMVDEGRETRRWVVTTAVGLIGVIAGLVSVV